MEQEFSERETLIGQLERARVRQWANDLSLEFDIPHDAPPLPSSGAGGVLLEGELRDSDGSVMQFLLHIRVVSDTTHIRDRRVSLLEIFKFDGSNAIGPLNPDSVIAVRHN